MINDPSQTLQGSIYIDHNVVSLKIDLTTLRQGKILMSRDPYRPPISKMPSKHGLSKAEEEGRKKLGHATIMANRLVPSDIRRLFLTGIESDGIATE